MEKIKQYKYIIILTLIILGGAFYWFEWRPSNILKNCYKLAGEKAVENYNRENPGDTSGLKYNDDQNTYYTWCLHAKGLK